MQIREFMTRLTEINKYLPQFPPFAKENKLPQEEVMEIAEFATPSVWQKAMVLHRFDLSEHTPSEFVEFCERLKYAKVGTYKTESKTNSKNGNDGTSWASKTFNKNPKRKLNEEKFCEYHQVHEHDTGECKVVLAQAKRMRAT